MSAGRATAYVAAFIAGLIVAIGLSGRAGDLGVDVYGASRYAPRGLAERYDVDHQFNPGLGLRLRWRDETTIERFAEIGAFRDPGAATARIAGIGAMWRPGGGSFSLGAALAGVHSPTYNFGRAFLTPMPIVAYDWRGVTINAAYAPMNRNTTVPGVVLWLTAWTR